jgi:hypothetical protein
MFGFFKKKQVEVELPQILDNKVILELDQSQQIKYDVLLQAHSISCNTEHHYLMISRNEGKQRVFFKCGKCERAEEIPGKDTPPTKLT